ncbi:MULTISPECIES: prolyl-tRNA synthetase associated domain-containing protein [Sphingopyxis]|jgi:Ala-tRNA(Pro) deacylase|uniref:Ala-tRNA(Pro) deacylase n=1 Tax=Sphingopyxis terrae subsp. ummariensis TaxID=429001 RepID=A0A1Y6EMN8_9SPHN|nr:MULTISPECIES: prolyl-tRNA synthetase associated domain-containing protein [Sphingopyxis]KTE75972.1 DNA-binding protein [Sphingopyxis sp. A083]MDX8357335.1 prolyl-tRNA synthetase associated domain-containing protein [Sphingopyxis terrae]PCF92408.1 prolyl-tRNA synthetase associated domain-containing protein [Sphingopyxis terrae subsp. ummariensis]SMQ63915.1 Ala-tRNA(Pro) deacylase [Sphingopyxis terrae subsp. ummariensis]
MRGEAGLLADLDALAIPFTAHEHVAVFTVAESDTVNAAIPGAHTKNLFLKDAGGAFWLVTVPGEARVDLKALPAAIGCKRVSFGKADDMQRLLGIAPGSVTPLAAINAAPGSITVVLDAGLAAAERVNVHPLRNTGTIGLAGATILDLLRHWGHEPLIASIPVQDNP